MHWRTARAGWMIVATIAAAGWSVCAITLLDAPDHPLAEVTRGMLLVTAVIACSVTFASWIINMSEPPEKSKKAKLKKVKP